MAGAVILKHYLAGSQAAVGKAKVHHRKCHLRIKARRVDWLGRLRMGEWKTRESEWEMETFITISKVKRSGGR